jgi:hypothetical protein
MADNQQHTPFYRDPIKVLTAVSIIIGTVIGGKQIYDELIKDSPPPIAVEYVIDASHAMSGRIEKQPKLTLVRDNVVAIVRREADTAFALRFSGGACDSVDYAKPDVKFGKNNGDRFNAALSQRTPSGRTNFAQTVDLAVADLNKQLAAGTKDVFFFFVIGGNEECATSPADAIVGSLRRLQTPHGVDVDFKFVGVKAPAGVKRTLTAVKKRLKSRGFRVTVRFPNTAAKIRETLQPPRVIPDDNPTGR